MTTPLPNVANVGDAGHVQDHNAIVSALAEARTALGQKLDTTVASATYVTSPGGVLTAPDGSTIETGAPGDEVAAFNPNVFRGIRRPSFPTPALTSNTGLVSNSSAALVTNLVGTQRTGFMRLPGGSLRKDRPFGFGAKVQVGATDDLGTLIVNLSNNNTGAERGVRFTIPGKDTSGPNVNVSAGNGAGPASNGGQKTVAGIYDLWVWSDGTRYVAGMRRDAPGVAPAPQWGNNVSVHVDAAPNFQSGAVQTVTNFAGASSFTWDTVDAVVIRSSTATVEVLSTWVNVDGFAFPDDPAHAGYWQAQPIVAGTTPGSPSNIGASLVGKGWNGRDRRRLLIVGHPNGSTEGGGGNAADPFPAHHAALLDAGYLLLYVNGELNATSGKWNSDWGHFDGVATRKAALDWALTNFPQIDWVGWFGLSMGAMTGLNFHLQYPGYLSAFASLSGAVNLSDSYTNRGFSSTINTAYTTPPLTTPAGVAVTPVGVAGTTTYSYRVSAVDAFGQTLASTAVTTTTGNATLSATDFNRITWTAQANARSYNVFGRTGGSELLIANVTTSSYSDTGAVVTPAGGVPGSNTTGLTVNAVTQVAPHDPVQRYESLTDLPMKLWHGTADTLIPKAQNADTFAPLVNAAGGSAEVVTITGGGHIDAAFAAGLPPADLVAFFDAY